MKKIVIFGTGLMGELAHYYFSGSGDYQVAAFTADEKNLKKQEIKTYKELPVLPFENIEEIYPPTDFKMFVAIGYSDLNRVRHFKYHQAKEKGYEFVNCTSPAAHISPEAQLGENCMFMENTVIQPFARIGNNNVLAGCYITHYAVIAESCFIGVNTVIHGMARVNSFCFIGANCTIKDKISIGKENLIGMGSVILHDTGDKEVYIAPQAQLQEINSDKYKLLLKL